MSSDLSWIRLNIPAGQLTKLMSLTSKAYGALQSDPNLKHIFPTTWWDVGGHPDGENVVLSFKLKGGSELSFQIHKDAAQNMRDALDVVLGNAPVSPGGDQTKH